MDLNALRREYRSREFRRNTLSDNPFVQFRLWFEQAQNAGLCEPNAMVLATVNKQGEPSSRTVLLKEFDEKGFVFFTNLESRKSLDISQNPHTAMTFLWAELERQVIIYGKAEQTSKEVAEVYFAKRPRTSQLGTWSSHQDAVIPNREVLEEEFGRLQQYYEGKPIPLPPYWGGFRIIPFHFEFWQGRPTRLHDRFSYDLKEGCWEIFRLSP